MHTGVVKKAEHWRIDAFELWWWRKLLRVPWAARRSNQSILKEISPGCSLEGLMLKLKLQLFGHLMRRADSFEKTLMLGKNEGWRRRRWQRIRWLDGITDSVDMVDSESWWWTLSNGFPAPAQLLIWLCNFEQLKPLLRENHPWSTFISVLSDLIKSFYVWFYSVKFMEDIT